MWKDRLTINSGNSMTRSGGMLLVCVSCAFAQDTTFKARVSIVEVDAQVIGRAGTIDGLQLSDFTIEDERRPVTLRYCVQEETPLDLVLLFEWSKPMAPALTQMRAASENAMAEIRETDRVAVMSFGQDVQLEQPFTNDLRAIKQKVRIGLAYAAFASKPSIVESLETAAHYIGARPEPNRRKAVLMFTGNAGYDGIGLRNPNHAAVSKDLWAAGILLSAMVIPNAVTRISSNDNPYLTFALASLGFNLWDRIDDIAANTGGEMVYAENVGRIPRTPDPNGALRQVVRRMRKRYKLYYDMPPGKPGHARHIEIELSPAAQALHPDARIVGRKGYVVPKS
jgi:VWFA-related protein